MVVGGYRGAANLATAEVYDPAADAWVRLPDLARPRRGLGAAALAGPGGTTLLLAVGGWDGAANLASVEVLTLSRAAVGAAAAGMVNIGGGLAVAGAWRAGPPLATPRCSLACAAWGGTPGGAGGASVAACGGWDGTRYLATAERLDAGAARWEPLPRMLEARSYAAAGAAAGRLVVVGGWDGASATRLSSAEALSLPPHGEARPAGSGTAAAGGGGAGRGWVSLPGMSCPRYGSAVAVID